MNRPKGPQGLRRPLGGHKIGGAEKISGGCCVAFQRGSEGGLEGWLLGSSISEKASMGGLEPPTPAFGGQCSIQLSYMDVMRENGLINPEWYPFKR